MTHGLVTGRRRELRLGGASSFGADFDAAFRGDFAAAFGAALGSVFVLPRGIS